MGGRALETPAAVISQGTTPQQRTVIGTLASSAALVQEASLPTPAVTVIGEVVNLREKVAWFERRNGKSQATVTGQPLVDGGDVHGITGVGFP
jgi:precorrin-4 methylase